VPELPDLTVYIDALRQRIVGARLESVTLLNPFLLRSAVPPLASAHGRQVLELRRVGKRIAIGLSGHLWLVLHLMIAGRLHWAAPGAKARGRAPLARFRFDTGLLTLTEAGTRRLRRESHTLKRALTDPHLFSGIGNAYSDEILHRATVRGGAHHAQ